MTYASVNHAFRMRKNYAYKLLSGIQQTVKEIFQEVKNMFTTIARYIIDREAIAESDFNCHDELTFTQRTDTPVAEPHKIIAAIIAEIIERGEAV